MGCLSLVLLVCAISSVSAAKQRFILTGPKLYDKGTTEILVVTVFGIEQKGEIHVRLLNSSGEQVLSEVTVAVENGQTKSIQLPVPSKIPNDDYNGKLEVTGSIGDYVINRTLTIAFREPKDIVFINTDKPIYKEKQTVNIRVLATDSNLKPSSRAKEGEIWIVDPNRIRIAQWLNVSFQQGLIHREIPIPEEPVLGAWTIHVKIDAAKYTKTFKLIEYVLPPFQVKVTPPSYVLQNAKNATWKICAKYTYGKPVQGVLVTKLSRTRQYWQKEYLVIENSTEINGCKEVTLPVKELISGDGYYSYAGLELKAEVTEDGTGTKINSTGSVQPTNYPYTISRRDPDVQYFRPRIPLKITMEVKTPDSKPLPNEAIKVCIDVARKRWSKIHTLTDKLNVCKNYTSNQHGFVIFTIPPQDPSTVYIKVDIEAAEFDDDSKDKSLNRPTHNFRLTPWFSPSGSHLQLERFPRVDCSAIGPDVKVTQRFYYTFNEPGTKKMYYQIIARGEIVKHGDFNFTLQADDKNITDETYLPSYPSVQCSAEGFQWDSVSNSSKYTGEFLHSFELSYEMVPKARVLMYTVNEIDVVADSTWYDIDPCFANKVEMKFGEEKQLPGSKATIQVTAEPQSLCSIGVVDKSVYILDKGDILSSSQVGGRLQALDTSVHTSPYQTTPDYTYCQNKKVGARPGHYYGTAGYVDAITAFSSAGGVVLTDIELETRPCRESSDPGRCYRPRPPMQPTRVAYGPYTTQVNFVAKRPAIILDSANDRVGFGGADSGSQLEDSPAVTVRTNFPDTWLFQLYTVGDNGELILKQDMPDSITEWEGAAVCVHPEKGLGLSKTASIVAFQPFFASLTLPYSVIRNETVPVIVTVFNYLKDCLPIKVHLDQTEDFALHNGTLTRDVCVCGEKSITTRFHIKPWKLDQMNITVTALVSNEKDICGNFDVATNVQRSDTITKSVLVEAEGFLKEETINEFFCLEDLEGSQFNTEHLLQLPTEAVEDSVRGYISYTGDLMGPALEGLDRLVRLPTGCGEQNMIGLVPNIVVLNYLKAIGRLTDKLKQKAVNNINAGYQRQLKYIHPDGSYSAFGTRDKEGSIWLTAFVLKTFISASPYIDIDRENVDASKNWVLSKQRDNGCFPMVGTVHNKALKGGVGKENGTTSALTAYILIAFLESESVNRSVVEGGLRCLEAKNRASNYSLALFAYAAALANDPSAESYIKQLIDNAEQEGANLYWKNADKSIAVETAAYAILALLKLNRDGDFQTVAPIARWLTMQRNPYGGFHSTQDTVVGLQALAEYGARISNKQLDMELSIKTDDQINEVSKLTEENKLLTQRMNLWLRDEPETAVAVEAGGSGCALVQILLRYNLPHPEPNKDFQLLVQTEKSEGNCKKGSIRICVSYNHESGSNMAIVEVKMVSGYVPVKSTVGELLQKTELEIRRYEIKENVVNIYFTTLTDKRKCFSFDVVQENEVLDTKEASVKVYDYYDNDKVLSVPYALEENCSS